MSSIKQRASRSLVSFLAYFCIKTVCMLLYSSIFFEQHCFCCEKMPYISQKETYWWKIERSISVTQYFQPHSYHISPYLMSESQKFF